MTHKIGDIISAKVTDENDKYYFAQVDGLTYEIDKAELLKPLKVGGVVSGFAYENEKHNLQITKNIPDVRLGHFAWGTVTDIRRDLGVFVNIGLPNKDVVVSLDELPTIKELWPQRGDKLMITLRIDKKDRLWGELASADILQAVRIPAKADMKNKQVKATVYRLKMVGTLVITPDYNFGFIHPDERQREPRLGEEVDARVIGVRDDGVLNLSLRPRAYEAISDDAAMLLTLLQRSSTNSLPFTDKSDPKQIKKYFGMSKSQFKRAVGNLYKQRKITQNENGLFLVEESDGE
ncbi:S1-like domain-containing RNA-binding protein [Weissella cibaria]|uniref:CvfB family protein n=1 Tax=Weissella cibaria TaxID=137591 RepID=UPI000705946F|nr:S1-like domain-containing RNA-binding protein [Weissella cibaria]ALI33520.1 DNA-binding protein [Weissella cibaria]WCE25929.1 S1-like domain-containing RNA-binding protein [Weissella cibaria]WCE28117.1 S1-like domain-containing RNA-binding protein [Weissella cibaria]HCN26246.1 DNA-binding protein [Weissella cibaria]HCU09100.1 DNA-binding protein [Weissella cibaria]